MSSADTDFSPLDAMSPPLPPDSPPEAPPAMPPSSNTPAADINTQALIELAMVKGQLTTVIQLLQHNHVDTHRRIDDLKAEVSQRFDDLTKTVDTRFDSLDDRVATVEANERSTALRGAAYGGGAAALVTAAIEAIKHIRV